MCISTKGLQTTTDLTYATQTLSNESAATACPNSQVLVPLLPNPSLVIVAAWFYAREVVLVTAPYLQANGTRHAFSVVIAAEVVAAGMVEAGVAEAGVAGAGVAEAGVAEAGTVEAGVAEAGVAGAGVAETGVAEAGVAEAGVVD